MATNNNCDYHTARKGGNCTSCYHWQGQKCEIEAKVKADYRTDLVHAYPYTGRNRRYGVFK